jgi:hypothetical protein
MVNLLTVPSVEILCREQRATTECASENCSLKKLRTTARIENHSPPAACAAADRATAEGQRRPKNDRIAMTITMSPTR